MLNTMYFICEYCSVKCFVFTHFQKSCKSQRPEFPIIKNICNFFAPFVELRCTFCGHHLHECWKVLQRGNLHLNGGTAASSRVFQLPRRDAKRPCWLTVAMSKLSPVAIKRLMKEWELLCKEPGDGADTVVGGPLDESNMAVWSVKCTNLDHAEASPACQRVAKHLLDKGHAAEIEFRFHFPDNYPTDPPFVYVHKPRIDGGHIHGDGAMCLDVLHTAGWTPANKVGSLMRTIRSDINNVSLRQGWCAADGSLLTNSMEAARKSATFISGIHGEWAHRRAEPHRPASKKRLRN